MAKSLHKVQKQVSKKRRGKPSSLHENSRDSQRLRRAGAREEKIARLVAAATKANDIYVERVAYFQSALQDSSEPLTDDEMHLLTSRFVGRNDEEAEGLKAQRRPGRPASSQEERLRQRIDDEQREYRSGFWIPEMRDNDSRARLERWNGEWASLNTLNFVRIIRNGAIRPSSFPPKGLS